ncbi:MAG: hypothetical protein ACKVUT_04070 [Gaiella sp.]
MVRLGQLAFGLAFLVIGGAQLLGHAWGGTEAAWLPVVALLALGVAGVVAAVSALMR